jgi:large subunit ribosomal protein L22
MATRSKEEVQKIWDATNAPYRKSNKPPRLTKKEKKLIGVGKDEGRAQLKFARISARKIKIVADTIKNKNVNEAMNILRFTPKAGSAILAKLLKSAMSNAENNNNLNVDNLVVSEIYANQGPTMKRIMPKAQGRAARIRKRTSHITVVLREAK